MADHWSKHLAGVGYTGIALPSPEYRLLTLVYERNGARGHQNAFDQLASGVASAMPKPEQNAGLPAIAGVRTRSLDFGVGLKVLSGLVAALGGGTLGLDVGFKAARKLSFAYDGISSESLNSVTLQQSLGGVAAPGPGLLRDWLDDHLYVVTSILRASKISVTALSTTGAEAKIDVPVISGAVGGNMSVKTASRNESTVTFEGDAGVPIAARLFQIVRTGGDPQRLTLRTVKEGSVTIKALNDAGGNGATDEELGAELAPSVLDWTPEREAENVGQGGTATA